MTTWNSDIYLGQTGTAGASANAASKYPTQQNEQGKLRITLVPYTLSTESTNDIIRLTRVKPGTKILSTVSRIVCEDPGTALTLDIGFASNPDALCDGAALTTAHDVTWTGAPSTTVVANQYVPAAIAVTADTATDVDIYATVVLATAPTAGAKILFQIAWLEP